MKNIDPYILIHSILWGITFAGLAWYCAVKSRQITYVTLADGRKQERSIPFIFRLLMPLTPNLNRMISGKAFSSERTRVSKKLIASGFEGLLTAEELISLRFLLPICLGIPWEIFAVSIVNSSGPIVHSC